MDLVDLFKFLNHQKLEAKIKVLFISRTARCCVLSSFAWPGVEQPLLLTLDLCLPRHETPRIIIPRIINLGRLARLGSCLWVYYCFLVEAPMCRDQKIHGRVEQAKNFLSDRVLCWGASQMLCEIQVVPSTTHRVVLCLP